MGSPHLKIDLDALASLGGVALRAGEQGWDPLQTYLERFGYLAPASYEPGLMDTTTTEAMRTFQSHLGLAATGVFDTATRQVVLTPRCGLPDLADATAFSRTCTWGAGPISVGFEPDADVVGTRREDLRQAVQRACATWAAAAPLEFQFIAEHAEADIVIGWRAQSDVDMNMSGPVLAHADFPPGCSILNTSLPKPLHFDDSELWGTGSSVSEFDLETVTLHELGHLLGLQHSTVPGSVMYPSVSAGTKRRRLAADDIAGIRDAYPEALSGFPVPGARAAAGTSAGVASSVDGTLHLVAVGLDRGVYVTSGTAASWQPWSRVPGALAAEGTSAGVAASVDGTLHVVAVGLDRGVYVTSGAAASWQPWSRVPGPAAAAGTSAALAASPDGTLHLVAVGPDRGLYVTSRTAASWQPWSRVPGALAAEGTSAGVAASLDGTLHLVAVGVDRGIYVTSGTAASWRPWSRVPGALAAEGTSAGLTASVDGTLHLAAVGLDRGIYLTSRTAAGWQPWSRVPGALAAEGTSAAVAPSADSQPVIAVAGTDGSVRLL